MKDTISFALSTFSHRPKICDLPSTFSHFISTRRRYIFGLLFLSNILRFLNYSVCTCSTRYENQKVKKRFLSKRNVIQERLKDRRTSKSIHLCYSILISVRDAQIKTPFESCLNSVKKGTRTGK